MLLAIDAGNTNIVFAVFDGEKLLGKWRLSTDISRTSDEYAIALLELFKLEDLDLLKIDAVVIASVVPQHNFALKSFCSDYLSKKPIMVDSKKIKTGITIKLNESSEVGADRIVNSLAAYKIYKKDAIILDFGTATTFDVISSKGDYLGGVIAPGIDLSIKSLHRAAAKLPEIAVKKPTKIIGKTTVSAMQSGIFFGYLGLIEGITERIKKEYGKKMIIIATGGLATLFHGATDSINYLEPDLTIIGLKEIYKLNS